MTNTWPGVVLIAELETTVRMAMVDLLEDEGFRTATASSVEQVLSALRETGEVHALIAARSLHREGDGIELVHRVHTLWPDVRIVVTSGAGENVIQSLPPGVRFLRKPYSFDVLLDEIKGQPMVASQQRFSDPLASEGNPALPCSSTSDNMAWFKIP